MDIAGFLKVTRDPMVAVIVGYITYRTNMIAFSTVVGLIATTAFIVVVAAVAGWRVSRRWSTRIRYAVLAAFVISIPAHVVLAAVFKIIYLPLELLPRGLPIIPLQYLAVLPLYIAGSCVGSWLGKRRESRTGATER